MQSNTFAVKLKGIAPIMFDRFESMKTDLSPRDKVYQKNGVLVLPSTNITSFLSAQNTESAPQRIIGKTWKKVAKAALSFVSIAPFEIEFTADGETIPVDSESIYIKSDKAIVKKGQLSIPSPKERPVLSLPWSLEFTLTLIQNSDLNENILRRLFEEGGITIGLGTYRGVYGKFIVEEWKTV